MIAAISSGSVVLGILNGMALGLLAVGLVLVYRSNRFLNLAHGQMGILSAGLLAKFVLDHGWSWWPALILALIVGVAVGLIIDRFAIRPMRERRSSPAALLLVTVGITQILIGLSLLGVFNPRALSLQDKGYPQPFHASLAVGGVVLDGANVFTAVAVPVIVAALALFLRYTALGQSIRAAASNPDAARLCGISTRRVSMVVWAIAGGLSALTAILQAPGQSNIQVAALGPMLLFYALGAAALAAFNSISLAMVGGIGLGLAQQLTLAATRSSNDGEIVSFLLIIAVLLVRGKVIGKVFAVSGAAVEDLPALRMTEAAERTPWIRHRRVLFPGVALALAVLAPLFPMWTSESQRFQLSFIPIYVLVALSLTVVLGWGGQINLGQFAVVGAGAFIAVRLIGHHWTLPFVIIVVGLIGALISAVIGIPALRVPGLTLAVTSLGFAIIGPDWLFSQKWFGTTDSQGVIIPPPLMARGLGSPKSHLVVYYVGVLLVVITALGLSSLRRTQVGRALVAVRDNGAAAAVFGITPAAIKVAAISLSGFIGAAAGVLWVDNYRYTTVQQFPATLSLAALALPVIGGVGSISGTVAAAVLFEASTLFIAPHIASLLGSLGTGIGFQLMIGGVGLTLAILRAPGGIAAGARRWMQRQIDRAGGQPVYVETPERPELVVNDVHLNFGGIKALNGASIRVAPGEIVGLIGPNGAGKTTLLNVISGRLPASAGTVAIGDVDITDLAPELRSAFGLSRSFQDARLFPGLTVMETIQLAVAKQQRASVLASAAGAPWVKRAERHTRQRAEEVVDRLGLRPWAESLTADLSTGTRRICDLAAQVAARPSVLLLDEPTAGVAQRETEAFAPLLRTIREELDCSILIVEHDMPMLMSLCDRVYALVGGAVIAEGTPEEIRNNPDVVASYLGVDSRAVDRSGGRRPPAKAAAKVSAAKVSAANKTASKTARARVATKPKD